MIPKVIKWYSKLILIVSNVVKSYKSLFDSSNFHAVMIDTFTWSLYPYPVQLPPKESASWSSPTMQVQKWEGY